MKQNILCCKKFYYFTTLIWKKKLQLQKRIIIQNFIEIISYKILMYYN